jgi:triosephosphate isomerase
MGAKVAVRGRPSGLLTATLIGEPTRLAEGRLQIGAQDCHTDVAGPHTGDIGAGMPRYARTSAVLVGHSERWQNHGETDALAVTNASATRTRVCWR